jgi:myo-inositol-1(or 4)-monophosphatase
MPTLQAMLDVAVAAAQAAGTLIRTAAQERASGGPPLQVGRKQANDFVTSADIASEQAIVRCLLGAFPAHAVRTEESAQAHGAPGASHLWIVDPLDGTTNFIHGYPAVGVSIALAVQGRIELGVVLDVATGDLFRAARGSGAFCNGRRLQVATRAVLDEALVATSCPHRAGPGLERSLQMLGAVMARVGALRRSGSAALDLARVAAGQCDASFDLGLNAWDVAAGSLLVTEAGGEVSDFDGGDGFLEGRACIAGNPALRAALGGMLQPFAPRRDPSTRH